MGKFAVGFLDFSHNVLEVTIVDAANWVDALEAAKPGFAKYIPHDTIDAAKEEAFNQDWAFDVKEIN